MLEVLEITQPSLESKGAHAEAEIDKQFQAKEILCGNIYIGIPHERTFATTCNTFNFGKHGERLHGKKILDVGAGLSTFGMEANSLLRDQGTHVISIDSAYRDKRVVELIINSKENLPQKILAEQQPQFVAGSPTKLPFLSDSFDTLVSNFEPKLVSAEQLPLMLQEMLRVSKSQVQIGPFIALEDLNTIQLPTGVSWYQTAIDTFTLVIDKEKGNIKAIQTWIQSKPYEGKGQFGSTEEILEKRKEGFYVKEQLRDALPTDSIERLKLPFNLSQAVPFDLDQHLNVALKQQPEQSEMSLELQNKLSLSLDRMKSFLLEKNPNCIIISGRSRQITKRLLEIIDAQIEHESQGSTLNYCSRIIEFNADENTAIYKHTELSEDERNDTIRKKLISEGIDFKNEGILVIDEQTDVGGKAHGYLTRFRTLGCQDITYATFVSTGNEQYIKDGDRSCFFAAVTDTDLNKFLYGLSQNQADLEDFAIETEVDEKIFEQSKKNIDRTFADIQTYLRERQIKHT